MLVLLELELELYKYIAEMETDLHSPTWRGVLSASRWDRRMQDAREGLGGSEGISPG